MRNLCEIEMSSVAERRSTDTTAAPRARAGVRPGARPLALIPPLLFGDGELLLSCP